MIGLHVLVYDETASLHGEGHWGRSDASDSSAASKDECGLGRAFRVLRPPRVNLLPPTVTVWAELPFRETCNNAVDGHDLIRRRGSSRCAGRVTGHFFPGRVGARIYVARQGLFITSSGFVPSQSPVASAHLQPLRLSFALHILSAQLSQRNHLPSCFFSQRLQQTRSARRRSIPRPEQGWRARSTRHSAPWSCL